jgi:prevent-host-death family protein
VITETTAVSLRQNLGDMLNRVQYRRDSILITKDGKPVAALVDAAMFERIRRMQERFEALSARLVQAYEGAPDDGGLAEIEAASAQARLDVVQQWRAEGRLPGLPGSKASGAKRSGRAAAKTSGAMAAAAGSSTSR